jgi:hypothetical protein
MLLFQQVLLYYLGNEIYDVCCHITFSLLSCSLIAANRDANVFGDDANEFKPQRWFNEQCPHHVTFGLGFVFMLCVVVVV